MATHNLNVARNNYLRPGFWRVRTKEDGTVINEANKFFIATRPEIPLPKKRVNLHTTKGRTGYVMRDLGTYEPTEWTLELSAIHESAYDRENTYKLVEKLMGQEVEFDFYFDPFARYQGVITDVRIEGNRNLEFSNRIFMDIYMQPYRIFDTQTLRISNGDSIYFPHGRVAVRFRFNGSGTVTIGNMTFDNLNSGLETIVDCENMRSYSPLGQGISLLLDKNKRAGDYYQIESGKAITVSGSVSNLKAEVELRSN